MVPNTIIATIVRRKEVVVPHGKDVIKAGDRIIVITKQQKISTPSELISKVNGGLQNELLNGIKNLGILLILKPGDDSFPSVAIGTKGKVLHGFFIYHCYIIIFRNLHPIYKA